MKRLDLFFYIVFFAIIGLLSWKIYNLKTINQQLINEIGRINIEKNQISNKNQSEFFGKIVPQFSLPYVDGIKKFSFQKNLNDKYYLFIFFTPLDCYSCFSEIPFWSEIKNKYKERLNVFAIATGTNLEQLRYFIKNQGIKVPVLYDHNGLLFEELELTDSGNTPIKLLTNFEGIVLSANKTTYRDSKRQAKYLKLLENLLL